MVNVCTYRGWLTIGHLIVDPSALFLVAVSTGFTVLIAFGLFYFGLFGGADAKAILCLGVTMPLAPSTYPTLIGYLHPFFPIVVTITSYLCSSSVIIWLGLLNVRPLYSVKATECSMASREESSGRKFWHALQDFLLIR